MIGCVDYVTLFEKSCRQEIPWRVRAHDNGLMEDIDPDHMTLLGEPLNEIAHNIIRHCPAGCESDCSVMLHDDVAEVTQYNSVTHPADKK